MNFIKKNKIFLGFASLSLLSVAISCSNNSKVENNKTKKQNLTDKKSELKKLLSDDILNIGSDQKSDFETKIENAKSFNELNKISADLNKIKESSIGAKSIEELKTYAINQLSNLRDIKNYESKITLANEKASLVNIIKEIEEEVSKQGDFQDSDKERSKTEFNKLVSEDSFAEVSVFELYNPTPNFLGPQPRTKNEVLPTAFIKNLSLWKAKVKPKYSWFLDTSITNARYETTAAKANQSGELLVSITFFNKFDDSQVNTKTFKISGFKSNPQGLDDDGTILTSNTERLSTPDEQYVALDQKERFNLDDSKYVTVLKEQLRVSDWKNLRKDANTTTEEQVKKYNEKAKEVGLSSYESTALKGFSLPKYKADGSFEGFSINTERLIPMGPTWADALGGRSTYQIGGLSRRITNKNYLNIAKQSYSVSFSNQKVTELESEKLVIQRDLQFKDHLEKFAENIKDQTNREKYLQLIKDAKSNPYYLKQHEAAIWDIIASENTPQFASDTYVKYLNGEREFYNEIVDKLDVRQDTKDNLKKEIANLNQFYNVERLGNDGTTPSGTMWIMDYEIPADGKYPTKFYFGTNLHVADSISKKRNLFSGLGLIRLNGDNNGIFNNFKIIEMEVENETFTSFMLNPEVINVVFDGRDYLNTSPKDFITESQKSAFNDAEEFLDFAVIEIDFSKVDFNKMFAQGSKSLEFEKEKSKENFAAWVTNNYAKWEDKDKAKFKSESYLKNYKKIEFPLATKGQYDWSKLDQIFALGFPKSISKGFYDYFFKPYIDDDQKERGEWSHSLWTNADHKFYDIQVTEDGPQGDIDLINRGNFLSYNIGFRSFAYKPGLTDAFLAAPLVGENPDPIKNMYVSTQDDKKYINYGLEYLPRWFTPGFGASGSSLRTQNNEIVAIYHATNPGSNTGLAAAFRSEGFDYNGMFGNYKLPQYDLIYGGGKEQKNSYRQAMLKLNENNPNAKTYLFPEGFNKIPKEFEFKETDGYIKFADQTKQEKGKNE
ncbi:Ig-specific serine endopeptidase MIP [Mycoplasma sp. OR1901]|uniref:Ig-specific serine endopeptidase MIP n=1 Tax=Mycoplasma sp. OR1901 TaxID=2742195 RepID=UPI0015826EE7|nr:DUF31 family protein [Mycoplasma sp. OR1901]QKT05371.1 hypothetical protein HTZ87_01495 [Mycoplasma sp. OR1901]